MMKLWSIAANAFVQAIRQSLYTVVLLATFGALVFIVAVTGYSMETDMIEGDTRLMVNFSLSTLMAAVLLVAVFSAARTLSEEIERHTVLTVVTKPVSRPVILLGKFLGVAAAVTLAFYLMSIVLLMVARHGTLSRAGMAYDSVVLVAGISALLLSCLTAAFCSYFFGWQMTSTLVGSASVLFTAAMGVVCMVGEGWQSIPFGEGIDPQIVIVLLLFWFAAMIMTALAVAVSTRASVLATLGVCFLFFAVSLLSKPLFGNYGDQNPLAALMYRAIPNLSFFLTLDELTTEQAVSGRYLALAAGYAACYTGALLLLGMALFQTREMDAREGASVAPSLVNLYAWLLRVASLVSVLVGLVRLAGGSDLRWILAMIGGIGGWLLAGYFGRGSRWAMRLVLLLTASQLVLSVTYLIFLRPDLVDPAGRLALFAFSGVQALYVAYMRASRPARAHFGYLKAA